MASSAGVPPPGRVPSPVTARRPVPAPDGALPSVRHQVARLEDRWNDWVERLLRRRGWTVRIEPFAGYGSPTQVRVLARAVLAPPSDRAADLPHADAPTSSVVAGPVRSTRGWRSFATAQVAGAVVDVEIAGAVHRLVADRDGYVDALVPVDLPAGWCHAQASALGGRRATIPVLVVGPETTVGIVSDIDDTVMVTLAPRPLIAAWNVFVRRDDARVPVRGMADLYRALGAGRADVPVVYVSNGAWNSAPAIGRFLRRFGFPSGPMLLTDWGPTTTGWFRNGTEHKRASLRRLATELPHVRWVLVGDDGQRDPQIYDEFARAEPDRVRAVIIRELTRAQQLRAHGAPVPMARVGRRVVAAGASRAPVLRGVDGVEILRAWRARGLRLD